MCVAIEDTPTSGRRALTQLISAARLNGSAGERAPSATSSGIVGSPLVATSPTVIAGPRCAPVERRNARDRVHRGPLSGRLWWTAVMDGIEPSHASHPSHPSGTMGGPPPGTR
jgi:hypothetical protein